MKGKARKLGILLLLLFFTAGAAVHMTSVDAQAAKNGFVKVDDKTYYYQNGKMYTGWLTLNGKKYYFAQNGVMATGFVKSPAGKYRYFSQSTGVMAEGWVSNSEGKLRYFFKNTGYMAEGWVSNSEGKMRYFFRGNGYMAEGWVTDSNNGYLRYFYNGTGYMAEGWVTSSTTGRIRYFCNGNGYMAVGWVKNSAGNYRYFNKSTGYMETGWITDLYDSSKKYYFDPGTGVAWTGFQKVGSDYYYFSNVGLMYNKGRLDISGNTYYFSPSNGKMLRGWLEEDGKKYYFGSDGIMYRNCTKTISGQSYTFDSQGVATLNKYEITPSGYVKVYENGRYFILQPEFLEHPGVADGSLSDEELLAALVYCEAGDQGSVGMAAVALTILNRAESSDPYYPESLRYVIYQQTQYSPVFDGALERRLENPHGYGYTDCLNAVRQANSIMTKYKTQKIPRVLPGFDMGTKKDFDFLFFMTPGAFNSLGLDWAGCGTYQHNGHVFFTKWVTS